MLGSIAGDVIGSVYEANPIKKTDFPLFSKYSRFLDLLDEFSNTFMDPNG